VIGGISAALRQGPHFKGCSDGESLATCGRFDRLGIWTPYLSDQKRTSNLITENKDIPNYTLLTAHLIFKNLPCLDWIGTTCWWLFAWSFWIV